MFLFTCFVFHLYSQLHSFFLFHPYPQHPMGTLGLISQILWKKGQQCPLVAISYSMPAAEKGKLGKDVRGVMINQLSVYRTTPFHTEVLLRLQSVTSRTFKAKQLRVLMKLFHLRNPRTTVFLWMLSVKVIVVSCIPILRCN